MMKLVLMLLGFLFAPRVDAVEIGGDVVIKGLETEAGTHKAVPKLYHTGLRKDVVSGLKAAQPIDLSGDPACQNLPDAFEVSSASKVRDQGQCGSCWAFSETGALESKERVDGHEFDLAEQELVSDDHENYGCNGGNLSSYQAKHGQGLESSFPYTARDSSAREIPPVAHAPEWVVIAGSGKDRETSMRCALYKYGTVPWVTVGADNDWGSPPTSDGDVWTRCSNNSTNHAIGYTGWKTVGGKVYFHAKNSWGTGWGQKGYAWIPLGCDGFGEEVAFLPPSAPGPTPGPGPVPPPPPPPPPPPAQWSCSAKSGLFGGHSWGPVVDIDPVKAAAAVLDLCRSGGGWWCRSAGCQQQ